MLSQDVQAPSNRTIIDGHDIQERFGSPVLVPRQNDADQHSHETEANTTADEELDPHQAIFPFADLECREHAVQLDPSDFDSSDPPAAMNTTSGVEDVADSRIENPQHHSVSKRKMPSKSVLARRRELEHVAAVMQAAAHKAAAAEAQAEAEKVAAEKAAKRESARKRATLRAKLELMKLSAQLESVARQKQRRALRVQLDQAYRQSEKSGRLAPLVTAMAAVTRADTLADAELRASFEDARELLLELEEQQRSAEPDITPIIVRGIPRNSTVGIVRAVRRELDETINSLKTQEERLDKQIEYERVRREVLQRQIETALQGRRRLFLQTTCKTAARVNASKAEASPTKKSNRSEYFDFDAKTRLYAALVIQHAYRDAKLRRSFVSYDPATKSLIVAKCEDELQRPSLAPRKPKPKEKRAVKSKSSSEKDAVRSNQMTSLQNLPNISGRVEKPRLAMRPQKRTVKTKRKKISHRHRKVATVSRMRDGHPTSSQSARHVQRKRDNSSKMASSSKSFNKKRGTRTVATDEKISTPNNQPGTPEIEAIVEEQLYDCEHNCGFVGTFKVVRQHELTCKHTLQKTETKSGRRSPIDGAVIIASPKVKQKVARRFSNIQRQEAKKKPGALRYKDFIQDAVVDISVPHPSRNRNERHLDKFRKKDVTRLYASHAPRTEAEKHEDGEHLKQLNWSLSALSMPTDTFDVFRRKLQKASAKSNKATNRFQKLGPASSK